MFQAVVKSKDGKTVLLKVSSTERRYMRYLTLLCNENVLPCEVTEEVKPRQVKFKNIEP
jgi:hypothetical protein